MVVIDDPYCLRVYMVLELCGVFEVKNKLPKYRLWSEPNYCRFQDN